MVHLNVQLEILIESILPQKLLRWRSHNRIDVWLARRVLFYKEHSFEAILRA